ncbi:MAG: hypothetical protein ABEH43_06120 [Flavobacteriales bacterium]
MRTDLEKELVKESNKLYPDNEHLNIVYEVLNRDVINEKRIKDSIDSPDPSSFLSKNKKLNKNKIFTEKAIKNLCMKYRLRFLNSSLYQGELPQEALNKIRKFEKKNNVKVNNFKIIAPEEKFQLKDSKKDPLLFIPLENNHYYLIHKWGNDMSYARNIFLYPLRNITTFSLCIFAGALILTMLLPESLFKSTTYNLILLKKVFTFFISYLFLFTSSIIFGIKTNMEFSSEQWNSEFFN